MSRELTRYRVFFASQIGLREERLDFVRELLAYSQTESVSRGVYFEAAGWEDALSGVGRPQSIVNEDLLACDFFVLVLGSHSGSLPSRHRRSVQKPNRSTMSHSTA